LRWVWVSRWSGELWAARIRAGGGTKALAELQILAVNQPIPFAESEKTTKLFQKGPSGFPRTGVAVTPKVYWIAEAKVFGALWAAQYHRRSLRIFSEKGHGSSIGTAKCKKGGLDPTKNTPAAFGGSEGGIVWMCAKRAPPRWFRSNMECQRW